MIAAPPAEFQAQVEYTEQGSSQIMEVYVKGDRYRIERTADGQPAVVLVDRARKIIDLISASEKSYHESSTSNPLAALYDPFEVMSATASMSEGTTKNLGTQNVNGYLCDKYELLTKDGSTALVDYWIARDLNFPVKIVVPLPGGMTLNMREVKMGVQDDALFKVPAGLTFIPEPGSTPPPWSKDVATSPLVAIPYERVMSSGEIIRVRMARGQTLQVIGSQSTAKRTQITAVPFDQGKPIEDIMPDTFNFGPGEKWTVTVGPASASRELVVRVNLGRALITVRRK